MGRFRNDESHGHPFRDRTTIRLYPYPNFPRRLQPGSKNILAPPSLLADLFVTGTNALTRQGQLVNVDMVGNRVAGITFGPEHVVLFIGTNKITDNIEQAMERIRTIAAPLNAIRHPHLHTPCQTTRTCMNCQSTDRLCNTWTITEKSLPQKRIKIILINESLGL